MQVRFIQGLADDQEGFDETFLSSHCPKSIEPVSRRNASTILNPKVIFSFGIGFALQYRTPDSTGGCFISAE